MNPAASSLPAPSASRPRSARQRAAQPPARAGRLKLSDGQKAIAYRAGADRLMHGTYSPTYLELSAEQRIGYRAAAKELRRASRSLLAFVNGITTAAEG